MKRRSALPYGPYGSGRTTFLRNKNTADQHRVNLPTETKVTSAVCRRQLAVDRTLWLSPDLSNKVVDIAQHEQ